MNTLRTKIVLVLAMFALALSACAPSSAIAAQLTPSPTTVIRLVTSTPVPGDTPAAIGTPAEVVPTGTPDGGIVVSRSNDNQTVTLHVGQSFLLNLGQEYDWSPVIDDQSVISRIPNISVIMGAQGIYLAHQAGSATMTATGDPPCRQAKPACMMPSLVFTLNIQVQP
jgi:hypothetical protein